MPTLKQKRAIDKLVGNGGNITAAMIEAGYSPNTANTPQKLTESVGFKELCEQYLPDDLLLGALKEDITLKKQNRKAELELGFKIKGRLIEKSDITSGGKPIPIYGGQSTSSIQGHDSDKEDISDEEKN